MSRQHISILILTFFGCSTITTSESESELYRIKQLSVKDLPQARNIKGVKMELPEIVHPRRILSLKDFLLVSETRADTLIHVVKKPEIEYEGKIGVFGSGPGEIQSPWSLLEDEDENAFWAQQLSSKTLTKFNLVSGSERPVEYYRQEGDMFLAVNLVWSSDSTLIGTRADGWDKFIEYTRDGKIVNTYGTWKDMLDQDVPSNVVASIHQGRVLASPDRSKILLACLDRDLVEILDRKTSRILSIRGPIHHTPEFSIDYSPGYPMAALDLKTVRYCYVSAVFGKQRIYLLFSGHSHQEVDVMKNKFCEQIFVMDFEGNITDHLMLDTSIKEFTVDEHEGKIYGLTIDRDPSIIVFDF
jgi:hypothetical protein